MLSGSRRGVAFWRQRDGKQWGGPVKDTVKLFQGKMTLKWSSEDLGRVERGKAFSSTHYVLSRFSGPPEGEHPTSRQAVKTQAARWDWAIAKLTPREAARTYETQLWKRGSMKKESPLGFSHATTGAMHFCRVFYIFVQDGHSGSCLKAWRDSCFRSCVCMLLH